MKERPILFKDEMVRALLEGRKTQTRRSALMNCAPVKQIAPKRQQPRSETFTMRDKLAVMALHVPGLIVGDEREGTTNEILALFEIDHIVACTFGGTSNPQNGRPLRRYTGVHRAKSSSETKAACKSRRIARVHQDWWQRVMARSGQAEEQEKKQKPRRKIPSRPFPKRRARP